MSPLRSQYRQSVRLLTCLRFSLPLCAATEELKSKLHSKELPIVKNCFVSVAVLVLPVTMGASLASADSTANYVFGSTGSAPAATLTVTLSNDSTLTFTAVDQGWFSATESNVAANTNYIIGESNGNIFNDFFTFNLSTLSGQVTSATLAITQGQYVYYSGQQFTFGGSSCSSATLDNVATNSNCAADGTYGTLAESGDAPGTLEQLVLSSAAITAINQAARIFRPSVVLAILRRKVKAHQGAVQEIALGGTVKIYLTRDVETHL